MFVEPQPGSGFDRVAPAYLVRRLLGRLFGRDEQGDAEPPAQQPGAATRQSRPRQATPDPPS